MARQRVAIKIRPENYDMLRRLLPDDPDFPGSFDEWLARTTDLNAKLKATGIMIIEVDIDPQEFADYCRRCGITTDRVGLQAFAVSQSRYGV